VWGWVHAGHAPCGVAQHDPRSLVLKLKFVLLRPLSGPTACATTSGPSKRAPAYKSSTTKSCSRPPTAPPSTCTALTLRIVVPRNHNFRYGREPAPCSHLASLSVRAASRLQHMSARLCELLSMCMAMFVEWLRPGSAVSICQRRWCFPGVPPAFGRIAFGCFFPVFPGRDAALPPCSPPLRRLYRGLHCCLLRCLSHSTAVADAYRSL
jgi:hypothetical protein